MPYNRAIPQQPSLAKLAELLQNAKSSGNQYSVPDWVPLLGGSGAGDMLLGNAPEEIENWSYGDAPMQIPEMSNVPQFKRGRAQSLADALTTLAPGVKVTEGLPAGLSFIGPKSRNWDKVAAELAAKKLDEGADPAEVWREHLIGRMPDKTLFSEISDKDAQAIPKDKWSWANSEDLRRGERIMDPVSAFLSHPELHNAYHGMIDFGDNNRRLLMNVSPERKGGFFGDDIIGVGMVDDAIDKSTAMHELQHAIQDKEGWGQGGDLGSAASFYIENHLSPKLKALNTSLIENGKLRDTITNEDEYVANVLRHKQIVAERDKLNDEISNIENNQAPKLRLYNRLAGEAQARATQDRMDMDMAQRRENYPLAGGKLSDIPLEDLIYKYEGNGPSLDVEGYAEGGSVDKDSLQIDKPRRTPNHPTKSHIVKTMVDGKEKIIRFGEQGAQTAGKPKEGESDRMTAKRESFKARHAKNIAKGKSSAAYWANKVKWAEGGSVSMEDLPFDDPDQLRLYHQAMQHFDDVMENTGGSKKMGKTEARINYNTTTKGDRDRDKDLHTLIADYGVDVGKGVNLNATMIKPIEAEGVYLGNLAGSVPVGEGRASLGLQGLHTKYSDDLSGYTAGYNGKVGDGNLSASYFEPADHNSAGRQVQLEYSMPFADGGSVSEFEDPAHERLYRRAMAHFDDMREKQNFEDNDSMIASTILHPVEAAKRYGQHLNDMYAIATDQLTDAELAAAKDAGYDEESYPLYAMEHPIFRTDAQKAEAGMEFAGLAQTSAMPFASKSAGGVLGTLIKPIKASEAYGRIEGENLHALETDRTKVGKGFLGGVGFTGLQHTSPPHAKADSTWGVQTPSKAATIINGTVKPGQTNPVFTTFIGSPDQHKSNNLVFDRVYKNFTKALKDSDVLTPELIERMNERLATHKEYVDKKTGKPFFPANIDVLSKNLKDYATTFDRRKAIAEVLGGEGVGGKKAQIFDYDKVIRDTTDPTLLDVPTGALGNRLFTLNGGILTDRYDLNPAFPTILQGKDFGLIYEPVPRELVFKDFVNDIRQKTGKNPGYMHWTRGYPPSQLITEDLLTEMQKAGYAKGGEVKALHDKYEESDYGYGNRPDKTKKGLGYFGELERPDGTGVMTEYSIGVPINGKEMDVPTLVPTLTPDEIRLILHLQEGEDMPRSIVHKAIDHAHQRLSEGKPIFATEEDLYAHGGIVDVLHNDAIEQIMKAFMDSMEDEQEEEPAAVSIQITTHSQPLKSGKIPTSIREAKHG
jgi:hypothetical protein